MRGALAVIAVLLAAVGAGCGGEAATLPPAQAAPPQAADVSWTEPTGPETPRLVFGVRRLRVSRDGWSAVVSVRNESGIPWSLGTDRHPAALSFGVMLFATGDLDELERRSSANDLPGLRRARTLSPAPPVELAPGAAWEGTISAPGSLAAGRWLRVVFGPLYAVDEPPGDLPAQLVWISDNAHQLES